MFLFISNPSRSEASLDRAKKEDGAKSFKDTKLVTNVKCKDPDDEELKRRQELVAHTTPKELAAIKGVGDLPIPKVFKSRSRSREKKKEKDGEKDSKRYISIAHLSCYFN